jgi:hypothetical protein
MSAGAPYRPDAKNCLALCDSLQCVTAKIAMRDCQDRNLGGWTLGVVRRSRPIVRTSAYHANVRRKVCLGSQGTNPESRPRVRFALDIVAKLRKCRATNFRERTKQATIADQCSFKPVTGIACAFGAWRRSPSHDSSFFNRRVYGSENLRPMPQKDFCNSIDPSRTSAS